MDRMVRGGCAGTSFRLQPRALRKCPIPSARLAWAENREKEMNALGEMMF